ncbi:MAG: NAD-dependent epimerase/dehydratase family protein, partial [Selenomonadaceae bacterium]|nr:NAD-dependent epimerase/dehydratase family protein [Selenomonadaceae bacterium]
MHRENELDAILHEECIPWEKLAGKTVLVTGGTGLIGFHLICALLHGDRMRNLGSHVIALVRDKEKASRMYRDFLTNPALKFLVGTVESLGDIGDQVDYIVHGAGITSSRTMVEKPVETIWTTVQGTRNLLEIAKAKKALGMVFLSSMEVYGRQRTEEPIGEERESILSPGNPRDCYPISKALAESLCLAYAGEYGVPATCLRLSQVLGYREEDSGEKKILRQMIEDIRNGRDIRLLTTGGSKRPYLSIKDTVTAILVVLLQGGSGIYNAADEESYCSVRELCEMAVQELAQGKLRVIVEGEELPRYPKENFLNLSSAKLRELGWKPSVGLREALRRAVASCEVAAKETEAVQSESEYIVLQFRKNFSQYRNKNLVIYGLGQNTKILLETFPEYRIIALMDEVKTGEFVWGLPVIDCKAAQAMDVRAVLILARPSNVPIIYRRIAKDCMRYRIPVYDIRGRRMDEQQKKSKEASMEFCRAYRKDVLMEKIRQADVVSFDVFDTLLMRKVLYPKDIFLLVEKQAKEKGILDRAFPFAQKRRLAEREQSVQGSPTIHAIYQKMAEQENVPKETADMLKSLEIEEERQQLVPRPEMADILRHCIERGKTVCCTSDMYMPKELLGSILREHHIEGLDAIFVSCEEGIFKREGLFSVLKHHYRGKRILHIGDNEEADIQSAERFGIDDVFPLHSTRKMLEDSTASGLLEFTETLEDRQEIGKFLSRQMADPFLFERTKGKLELCSAYDVGHDFLEPLMSSFLDWLIGACESDHIDLLMLGARDGWLLAKLLDIAGHYRKLPFAYRYAPASRTACMLAGMESKEDVMFAASQAFAGTEEELLLQRFRLRKDELLPRNQGESGKDYIFRHAGMILSHTKEYRRNYEKALRNLGIKRQQKKAYFDFVSSGTCQFWMEKILGERLKGYYFVRLVQPWNEDMDIDSFLARTSPMQNEQG